MRKIKIVPKQEATGMRKLLQAIALDYSVELVLIGGGAVIKGEMSEWDWDGDIVSLVAKRGTTSYFIEVRIDQIAVLTWAAG